MVEARPVYGLKIVPRKPRMLGKTGWIHTLGYDLFVARSDEVREGEMFVTSKAFKDSLNTNTKKRRQTGYLVMEFDVPSTRHAWQGYKRVIHPTSYEPFTNLLPVQRKKFLGKGLAALAEREIIRSLIKGTNRHPSFAGALYGWHPDYAKTAEDVYKYIGPKRKTQMQKIGRTPGEPVSIKKALRQLTAFVKAGAKKYRAGMPRRQSRKTTGKARKPGPQRVVRRRP